MQSIFRSVFVSTLVLSAVLGFANDALSEESKPISMGEPTREAGNPNDAELDEWDGGWGQEWSDDWGEAERPDEHLLPLTGYLEIGATHRLDTNTIADTNWIRQELKARIEYYQRYDTLSLSFKSDLSYDAENNDFVQDTREAYVSGAPASWLDIRAGRQILTWGTGDLLFLNDFFPKDWKALFNGSEQQYLKAPSDALKLSAYSDFVNIDVAWSPEFDPDNYINGSTHIYYNAVVGDLAYAPPVFSADTPDSGISSGELSIRLFKTIAGNEFALYAHRGFYKTPAGFNASTGRAFYPRLQSIGVSTRGTIRAGIGNAEIAHWHSADSNSGTNPEVPHSETRFLVGYESEVLRNLTANFQVYAELTHDYSKLKEQHPNAKTRKDRIRQVLASRWTYLTNRNKFTSSVFAMYSPTDQDFFINPDLTYRFNDNWAFSSGLNLMGGREIHTMFGQFEDNSNAYVRTKYIF